MCGGRGTRLKKNYPKVLLKINNKTILEHQIDLAGKHKFKEVILSKIPSAKLGEPEDIANAVLFLASTKSDYINGETLHVNGGMYMAWQSK